MADKPTYSSIVMSNPLPDTVKAGEETPVQIAPRGLWPVNVKGDDGKVVRYMQKLDDESISMMIDSFSSEVLVDADHNSDKGRSTEAYGWVTSLRDDPQAGLVGTIRWTDIGAEAVSNRRYRYVSASWALSNKTGRPVKLLAVALTNRPNIAAKPILNSVQEPAPATKEQPKGNNGMEKIRMALGLAPEATEEDIVASITAKLQELDDMKKKIAQNEAEQFADENKDKVEDTTVLKNAYLRDPATARMIVNNIRISAPPATQKVLNSRMALTPSFPASEGALREQMSALPPDQRQAFWDAHKSDFEK